MKSWNCCFCKRLLSSIVSRGFSLVNILSIFLMSKSPDTLGMKGGLISFYSSLTQSIGANHGCILMSPIPCSRLPILYSGSRQSRDVNRLEASWEKVGIIWISLSVII